jgi:hypothetical protein
MSRETDAQRGMLEQQLDYDREMRAIDRLRDLLVQGAKGLAVLNGGSVVALFAFVQALIDKPIYSCFKPYAVGGLICFIVGAILPVTSFFFHYKSIDRGYVNEGSGLFWRRMVWGTLIASAVCAVLGGMLIIGGISFVL